MQPELWLTIIPVALGVWGAIWGAAKVVGSHVKAIDRRLDHLEDTNRDLLHRLELEQAQTKATIEKLEMELETVFLYRINANTELIKHKASRLEGAVRVLSSALEKVSGGQYVPRGAAAWPTDNAPSQIDRS